MKNIVQRVKTQVTQRSPILSCTFNIGKTCVLLASRLLNLKIMSLHVNLTPKLLAK